MHLFKQAFIVIGLVLVLHAVLLLTDGYSVNQIDTPMHFFGGFAMGMLGIAIHYEEASRYHTRHAPFWYHYTFVVGFAMLIGIAWEFHEYLFDQTINVWFNLPPSQISLGDTMKDFLMDLLGATLAFFLLKKHLYQMKRPL
ncbi:hypothetical protein EPN81_01760 [Patescibacteria group bacterium]|nr:MAG: hypothetical protein EPN81_01760 [Patescibacteria group bacterium]